MDPPAAPEPLDEAARAALFASLTEQSADAIVVVFDDGRIRYMNPAAGRVTGWVPGESAGRSIFELVHPDDLDRAIVDLGVHSAPGAPPGWSTYRVRTADGSWLPMQLTSAEVTDGEHRLLATFVRAADVAGTQALFGLLRGSTPADALLPVLDMFNRVVFGSRVAIAWEEGDGVHHVGHDVPPELAGADGADGTPWAECRRDRLPRLAPDLDALDERRRALAESLGLDAYWIEPVVGDDAKVLALVTVWTRPGAPSPAYHMSGMNTAKSFVELILRWTLQVQLLDEAAHHDVLTGLANRRAFFDALDDTRGGAVLFCDLDRFKPVNDELGHRAGDELLRAVARRIQRCVRDEDVVARIGGDEFAVLCEGATEEQANDLAARIRAAVAEPFQVVGAQARVGISIGVAHTSAALGDTLIDAADRALYEAKAESRTPSRRPAP